MRKITQNNKGPKEIAEIQISPLVDTRSYCNEENHKLFRRKYQRTRNNEEQGEKNRATYFEKIKKRSNNKKGKTKSGKEYCKLTTEANPCNAVYRLAAGKKKNNTQITTLRKPDDSLTRDTPETLRLMLEYFTPEDNELEDNDHHKQVRDITAGPPNTRLPGIHKRRD